MPNMLDKVVYALLWCPFAKVKLQQKQYTRTTMHAPKKRASSVLGNLIEVLAPENKLPSTRPTP